MVIDPAPGSGLEDALSDIEFVNQTAYQPVRRTPIVVSSETKASESRDDGLLQASLWTAAAVRALGLLRHNYGPLGAGPSPGPGPGAGPESASRPLPVPGFSIPAVTILGHSWRLHYAFCSGGKLRMRGPQELGRTDSLRGAYVLLRNLRHLRDWAVTSYVESLTGWLMDEDTVTA